MSETPLERKAERTNLRNKCRGGGGRGGGNGDLKQTCAFSFLLHKFWKGPRDGEKVNGRCTALESGVFRVGFTLLLFLAAFCCCFFFSEQNAVILRHLSFSRFRLYPPPTLRLGCHLVFISPSLSRLSLCLVSFLGDYCLCACFSVCVCCIGYVLILFATVRW